MAQKGRMPSIIANPHMEVSPDNALRHNRPKFGASPKNGQKPHCGRTKSTSHHLGRTKKPCECWDKPLIPTGTSWPFTAWAPCLVRQKRRRHLHEVRVPELAPGVRLPQDLTAWHAARAAPFYSIFSFFSPGMDQWRTAGPRETNKRAVTRRKVPLVGVRLPFGRRPVLFYSTATSESKRGLWMEHVQAAACR